MFLDLFWMTELLKRLTTTDKEPDILKTHELIQAYCFDCRMFEVLQISQVKTLVWQENWFGKNLLLNDVPMALSFTQLARYSLQTVLEL